MSGTAAHYALLLFYGLPLLPFPTENHVFLLQIFFVLSSVSTLEHSALEITQPLPG